MHRILTQLNQQASPFKDDYTRDSVFTREMLDIYRNAEELRNNSTYKQIKMDEDKVFSFLKKMDQDLKGQKKVDSIVH